MPKMAKKLPNNLHGWAFYRIQKFFLNQESLPVIYHNSCRKSLVIPKSKSPNWQESQPISYKANFSQSDNIYPADQKYNITYKYIRGKTDFQTDFFTRKCLKWQKNLPNNLHGYNISYHSDRKFKSDYFFDLNCP